MCRHRGYLTVEATLLLLVSVSVFSILFSLGVIFQKNMQLYGAVENSAENTAELLYVINRLGSSLLENGKTLEQKNSGLTNFFFSAMEKNIHELSCKSVAGMINADLKRQLRVKNLDYSSLWLVKPPEIHVAIGDDAMMVESLQTFQLRGIMPFKNELCLSDKHIIPLKEARSLIAGDQLETENKVYLTNYGKSKSSVYHSTTNCFGFNRVKNYYTYEVKSSDIGSEIQIEGKKYHLCPFCASKKPRSK